MELLDMTNEMGQRMLGEMEYQETLTLRSMENDLLLCNLKVATSGPCRGYRKVFSSSRLHVWRSFFYYILHTDDLSLQKWCFLLDLSALQNFENEIRGAVGYIMQ